jgi:hypothetical protein
MPVFTIEITCRIYAADTLEQACRLAIQGDDWRFERRDDNSGEVHVSGASLGPDMAYPPRWQYAAPRGSGERRRCGGGGPQRAGRRERAARCPAQLKPGGDIFAQEPAMPHFTIETAYRLPVYRQRAYRAGTLEEACRLALADHDWSHEKPDYDCSSAPYVCAAWHGRNTAYRAPELPLPAQFADAAERKADHFPTLLALLKQRAQADDAPAQAAIAKAEAILAGAPDPA